MGSDRLKNDPLSHSKSQTESRQNDKPIPQDAQPERHVKVVGNGNVVAAGDIHVEGDLHIGPQQEQRGESEKYLLMLPDERGEITPDVVCHVKVTNCGQRKIARGCQGYMRSISLHDGIWEDIKSFPLKWEYEDSAKSVDVPPGYTRVLDAVVVHRRGQNYILGRPALVDTTQGQFERPVSLSFVGTVKIRLEVFDSDNARGFGTYIIHFQRGRNPSVEFIPHEWLD